MKDYPKLSVIIPVYNVENYIETCLTSVITQDYSNLEIIVVNDGSNDLSSEKIKPFLFDKRIRYFEKKNEGLSSARNYGLEVCTAEYITFLDSDDSIAPKTYSENMEFISKNRKIQMVQYPVEINSGSDNAYIVTSQNEKFSDKNIIISYWMNGKITFSVTNKIFKRILINDLKFKRGILYEDLFFDVDLMQRIEHCFLSNKGLYYYRYNPNSITKTHNSYKRSISFLISNQRMLNYTRTLNIPDFNWYHYLLRCLKSNDLMGIQNFTPQEKEQISKYVKEIFPSYLELIHDLFQKKLGMNGSTGIITFFHLIKRYNQLIYNLIK